MTIIGGIIAVVCLILWLAIQAQVHKDTGVWVSRSNLRYIRRQARRKGLPEEQVFDDYMARKQKRLGVGGEGRTAVVQEPENPTRSGKGWAIAIVIGIGIVLYIGKSMSSAPTSSDVVRVAMVDRAMVNCRQLPSESSSVVTGFNQGAWVTIVSEEQGWSRVQGVSCWIRSDLLRAS